MTTAAADIAHDGTPKRNLSGVVAVFVARMSAKLLYRARWQLVPFVAWFITINYRPAVTLAVVTALMGGYLLALDKTRLRPYKISRNEAKILCWFFGICFSWVIISGLIDLAGWVLMFTTLPLAAAWCWGRRIQTPWWSPRWWLLRSRWVVFSRLPGAFAGSRIVHGSYRYVDGATSFTVRLATATHPDALGEKDRLAAEAQITKWRGATSFTAGDTTRCIDVTVCPPGKHLYDSIPAPLPSRTDPREPVHIGTQANGKPLNVPVAMPGGVRHVLIAGATGGGKSHALDVFVRQLSTTHQVMVADGGQGSSLSGQLRRASAIARTPEQWLEMVESLHRISCNRRYADGIDEVTQWDPERWPAIALIIDECPAVAAHIGAEGNRMVLDLMRQGRKHGIAVVMCSQDVKHADLPGGGKNVREQISATGVALLLRPTRSTVEEMGNIPPAALSSLAARDPDKAGYVVVGVGGKWSSNIAMTHAKDGVKSVPCLPLSEDEKLLMGAPWGSWEDPRRASEEVSHDGTPMGHQKPRNHADGTRDTDGTPQSPTRTRAPKGTRDTDGTPPQPERTIGERIAEAQAQGHTSIRAIAEASGVSKSHVQRVLAEQRKQPA